MADSSRSRRKRSRNNRKKTKQNVNTTEIIVEENEYCVESPKRKKSPEKKKPIKSRSLDDDDLIKIQEVSETSENEDKSECKAIISEAESDVEWEVIETMDEPEIQTGTISTLSLPLKEYKTEEVTLMSPEEELSLRTFLEGLNLVNCPEDAFRLVREVSTMETVQSRRARKRAALEQYFSPMAQNPRFLDVISEETSDLSDREQPSLTRHLKQGTPEPEIPPGRPPRSRKAIHNPAILVGTKIMELPSVTHEICSTNVPQSSSTAEVVYLEDSSNSTTPDPKSDFEEEKDTNDDLLSSTNSSVPDFRELETVEEKKQVKVTVKKNDVVVGSSEFSTGEKSWSSQKSEKSEYVSELTPPPTPDDLSHKNETFAAKKDFGDVVEEAVVCRDDVESSEDVVRVLEDEKVVDSRDISSETEKIVEMRFVNEAESDKVSSDAESRTGRTEILKERIIEVEIEDEHRVGFDKMKNENSFSRDVFGRSEPVEDTAKIDVVKIISESTFNKTEGKMESKQEGTKSKARDDKDEIGISKVHQEEIVEAEFETRSKVAEDSLDRNTDFSQSISKDEITNPEGPKERIIEVEIEDGSKFAQEKAQVDTGSIKFSEANFKKKKISEAPRERIIEIEIENKPQVAPDKGKTHIKDGTFEFSTKDSFRKFEVFKERTGKTTEIFKDKNQFEFTEKNVLNPSDNSGSSKERIIEVQVEKTPDKQKTYEEKVVSEVISKNTINKPTTPKETMIKVEVEKDHQSYQDEAQIKLSKIPKERIIAIKIEDDLRDDDQKIQSATSDGLGFISSKTIFKDVVKTEESISSPKIIKLDDMKTPTVITPVNANDNDKPSVKTVFIKIESGQKDLEPKASLKKDSDIMKMLDNSFTKMEEIKIRNKNCNSPMIKIDIAPFSTEKYKLFSSTSNLEGRDSLFTKIEQVEDKKTSAVEFPLEQFLDKENLDKPTKLEQTCTKTEPPKIKNQIPIMLETNLESKPINKQQESPSKEEESICGNLRLPESIFYSNVLSPPAPSPSPSLSSGSSSRATSLCTAKYNSMSSSIADITSIKDEELLKGNKIESPSTLRELCVNFLMSQPFGADILQELADVSSSIEHLTKNLVSGGPKSPLPAFMVKEDDVDGVLEVVSKESFTSDSNPRLLSCLSPTQKSQLDKSKKVSEEASKLLDLHEKFINRTTYHDAVERQAKNAVEIAAIKPDVSNRLLAIIRDAQEPKFRKFSTLPRNMDSARLKAKDLSEWLQLARNKSRSELNLTDENNQNVGNAQRRNSLPPDFYEQMYYLQEKEREIQRELEMLEEEKRKLAAEMTPKKFRVEDYHISKKGDFAESKKSRPLSMPVSTEYFRQQMYEEYMDQMAAREERRQHKVIKVSQVVNTATSPKAATGIEDEFMIKVKEKQKLGTLKSDEADKSGDESEHLPKHIQEFMDIAKLPPPENTQSDGVWSPGQKQEGKSEGVPNTQSGEFKDEPISPIWTPKSATSSPVVERKEFRPIKFESPVLSRRSFNRIEETDFTEAPSQQPSWKIPETSSDTGIILSSTLEKRLPTSHSSPASGFNDFPTTRLPRAQNPTITLLQKAREGQLPKGALYIEQEQSYKRPQHERPPLVGPGEILYKIKNEYTSESDSEKPRKMADLGPRKYEGIGPTTRDGMPLILRSEVKDANQSKWYKKMYDTIHKQRPHRDEFVTVRYKQRRGQYPYSSGYLSEPEPGAYDSDFTDYKYATLDRRRLVKDKENDYVVSSTMPRAAPERVSSGVVKHGHDPYKNQPGRIENYITGHSSISDKEAKEWWDEVMDIFDVHLEQQKRVPQTKSFMNQALKESGYESDSTLVFRRRDNTAQQLSPLEQKEAYKMIQKGGDVPLHGLRKPAPERPKESPRKYVENEVTIHYKTPVRQEIKEYLSEDELAYRQAEAMKKIYQEERRRKYLQELQDMNNRRHTDNFIPSQKSPISLNRYDDFDDLSPPVKPRPRSPQTRLLARALYNFVGQTARELTFRKGDLIYVRRQVDKNWYEGELNAMVGLFPVNYVEIVTYDTAKATPRKSHEGQARAKYNFVAQTHLELSLAKGELVVITRRVDDNWFEGKIGGRKGIFPVSYVDVLVDASDPPPPSSKPVAAPAAHSLLLNGSAGGKESMGSHSYTPSLSTNQLTSSYHAKPVHITGSHGSMSRGTKNSVNQALHIETQAEPVPYRALYKYLPQNDDELELLEGDTVYVLEKCDDGWYVGSSDRTGAFGTFPGNYVEKI